VNGGAGSDVGNKITASKKKAVGVLCQGYQVQIEQRL